MKSQRDEHIQTDAMLRDGRLYDEEVLPSRDSRHTADQDSAPGRPEEGFAESDDPLQHHRIHEEGAEHVRRDVSEKHGLTSLFKETDAEALRVRWQEVQTSFVDEPRNAVQQADALVSEAIDHLTELFRSQRDELEHQWARGEEASTEDLRLMLQRYRSFFDRLLSV